MFKSVGARVLIFIFILVFVVALGNVVPVAVHAMPYAVTDSPGTLDTTFGMDGKTTTDFGGYELGESLAVQPDGKLIVAGYSDHRDYENESHYDFALARYNLDGSLDPMFDGDGKLTLDLGGHEEAAAVAVQPDGGIVVAGRSEIDLTSRFVLLRFNSTGKLDRTFGEDGKVITDMFSGDAVAIQSNGKIVVAGASSDGVKSGFSLMRFNSNGSLDTTFDGDGKVITYFGSASASGNALIIQPDGKLIVTGYFGDWPSYDFALARYNSNGSLDSTFGTDGKTTTDFGSDDTGHGIALQSDGKIVVVGTRRDTESVFNEFALARYNSNGSLDTAFDADGKVTFRLGHGDFGSDIVIQPDGKLLVAGGTAHSVSMNLDYDFALLRYNQDGSRDTTFGTDGKTILDFGPYDPADDLALQPDGKIILAGGAWNSSTHDDFALARYIGDQTFLTVTKAADTDDGVCDDDCSLREAIEMAMPGTTINFAENYIITLSSQLPVIDKTLMIAGNGAANTIIQASACNPVTLPEGCMPAAHRIFEINKSGSLTLTDLTLRHGNLDYVGGAIYNDGGTLAVNKSIISYNSANGGGGISSKNGTLTVTNSTFSNNRATGADGAAIASIEDGGTITNSIFSRNSATSEGGAIYMYLGTWVITNSVFSANSAYYEGGGAIYNGIGNVTVTNSTFSGCSTYFSDGGGIYNSGTLLVMNSTFYGNSTTYGGGGGIGNSYEGQLTVKNTTFVSNRAPYTLGGAISNNPPNSNVKIYNSILYGNIGGQISSLASSAIITNTIVQGGYAGNGNIDVDPLLSPLQDNGGFTQTMALGAGSLAVDAGDDANCPDTDQRGVIRPQGSHCDIGAYEFNGDPTAPTLTSIVRASPNHTSASSVNFAITFSEHVLEVDANDFTLHATGSITGATVGSVSGSGAVYTVTVSTGTGNGTLRLDMPANATITDLTGNPMIGLPFTNGQSYTLLKDATFSDVETDYWAWSFIERLVNAGITAGCGNGDYCPEGNVTRAQMAVFLLRGIHNSSYAPPAVGINTGFGDVQTDHWAGAWIKQLAAEGITSGCGNGNYCPDESVTRAQMAVFLLKARHGASYSPPTVGGSTGFGDVPTDHWAAAWIKQLVVEGITAGCGNNNYCPESPVTRAQMAVFLVRVFGIP